MAEASRSQGRGPAPPRVFYPEPAAATLSPRRFAETPRHAGGDPSVGRPWSARGFGLRPLGVGLPVPSSRPLSSSTPPGNVLISLVMELMIFQAEHVLGLKYFFFNQRVFLNFTSPDIPMLRVTTISCGYLRFLVFFFFL